MVVGGNLAWGIDPQQVLTSRQAFEREHAALPAGEVESAGAEIRNAGRIGWVRGANLRHQRIACGGSGGRDAKVIVARGEVLECKLQSEHAGRRCVAQLDAGRIEQFELDRIAFAGLEQTDAVVRGAHRREREPEDIDVGRPVERQPDDLREALDLRQHIGRGNRVVGRAGIGRVLRDLQHARATHRRTRRGVEGKPEVVEIGRAGEADRGAGQRRGGQRETEPVGIERTVDGETLDLDTAGQRAVAEPAGKITRVVAIVAVGRVHQDRAAGIDRDPVVAGTGVDPDGLLHGGADIDLVVAALRVDQDHVVGTFARQQLVGQVGVPEGEVLERQATVVRVGGDRSRLGGNGVEIEQRFAGVPHRVAIGILAGGVEADLGGEAEIAVVVGEPGDQVIVGQQAGLGHVIDRDHVIGIGGADVPDLAVLFGVLLPDVAAEQAAVERFELGAIDPEILVVAAVAVHEVDAGAAIELVVARRAEHAVQAGVFDGVGDPGRIAVQQAVIVGIAIVVEQVAQAVGEHAELSAQPGIA